MEDNREIASELVHRYMTVMHPENGETKHSLFENVMFEIKHDVMIIKRDGDEISRFPVWFHAWCK